jgi:DNA-binding transcriptional LysR family regulator
MPTLQTPSIEVLKRAVRAGGFTILSSVAVDAEVARGDLRPVALRDVRLERDLRMVRAARSPAGSPEELLWNWFERQIRAGAEVT